MNRGPELNPNKINPIIYNNNLSANNAHKQKLLKYFLHEDKHPFRFNISTIVYIILVCIMFFLFWIRYKAHQENKHRLETFYDPFDLN